jgi:hypothetical protein
VAEIGEVYMYRAEMLERGKKRGPNAKKSAED